MRGRLSELRDIALSPVSLGRVRWGNHPHARMSLLSVVLFSTCWIVFLCLGAAQWSGHPARGTFPGWLIGTVFTLTFVSGALDGSRHRRWEKRRY